jgi:methyl-accepting chemotaxis protein
MDTEKMGFLTNLSIGRRLGLGFALILSMTVAIAAVGVGRLNDVSNATSEMMAEPLAKERLVSDFNTLLFGSMRRTMAIVKSSDPTLADFFKEENQWSTKRANILLEQVDRLLTEPEERAQLKLIMDQRVAYNAARDRAVKAKAEGRLDESAAIFEREFMPAARRFQDVLHNLVDMQRKKIDATGQIVYQTGRSSTRVMDSLAIAAVLLSVVCSWFIGSSIVRPIRQAVEVAEKVAAGDLTQHIEANGKDETGALLRALHYMNESLVAIVGQVRIGTDTIATASAEISAGNMDLSSRTEQQAGSLGTTASTVEELTSTVRQNANNARQASQLSIAAAGVAAQGGVVVEQVVQTMGAINDSSKKIVDIISVIDGIAFQTNILALNAAVEAARAGEQGRGFAVVAGEVRTLAQRSAAAAKEIKQLIVDSVSKVEDGTKLVDQAGTTMSEVVASIRKVSDIVAEIASASGEQSTGIQQVNLAIASMDSSTQHNAALVEESAAAAAALRDQADKLTEVVSLFNLGGRAASPSKANLAHVVAPPVHVHYSEPVRAIE